MVKQNSEKDAESNLEVQEPTTQDVELKFCSQILLDHIEEV